MIFKPKKLLLILELNQTLVYIKNQRSKLKDFISDNLNIKYNDQIGNFNVLYRNGKQEFLEYLFNIDRDNIDVAIWTNLDSDLANKLTQKFFGRYYRDLLFVLPTNRGLYSILNSQPQDNIKIPRELNTIYSKFTGYTSENTLLLNTQPNTIIEHTKNDMIIPPFGPKYSGFQQDIGCFAVNKYLKGIIGRIDAGTCKDVRTINTGKPLASLFKRFTHRTFEDTKYI